VLLFCLSLIRTLAFPLPKRNVCCKKGIKTIGENRVISPQQRVIASFGSVNVVPHAGIRLTTIDMDASKFGAD